MNSPFSGKKSKSDLDHNKAAGVFYFSDEDKLVSCKSLLEQGWYTHHIDKLPSVVSYCEPPVLETQQAPNCQATPPEDVFSDSELLQMSIKLRKFARNH